MGKFKHFLACTAGNAATMMALAAVPMVGGAGVAIDTIRVHNVRATLAEKLDAAVLAGAASETEHVARAKAMLDKNFDLTSVNSLNAAFALEDDKLVGTATAEVPTTLSSLFGMETLTVKLRAVASTNPEPENTPCVMTLSGAAQSFLINSGADINGANCEFHVKSNANPAAILNAGTSLSAKKICISGSQIIDNGSNIQNVHKSCKTAENPYAGLIPDPANTNCTNNNGNYSGKTTLSPGVYCGWHNFNSGADVQLQPGTYVLKDGGWNVNGGEWKGNDVTFFFNDTSKIQFNSAVKGNLKAPKSGSYKGILFAEKEGLPDSQFILNDDKGFQMEGVIYLPSREVVFNSGANVTTQKLTAITRTIIFNGSKWNITGYDKGGVSAVKDVRLVE